MFAFLALAFPWMLVTKSLEILLKAKAMLFLRFGSSLSTLLIESFPNKKGQVRSIEKHVENAYLGLAYLYQHILSLMPNWTEIRGRH
jgi:hypothetical protein